MKETRLLMGMPVTVEIIDRKAKQSDIGRIFDYFTYVDETFSTYKESSEISAINAGRHPRKQWSADMRYVLEQCERCRQETGGYFNISRDGNFLDPSGYVKGWAIQNAAARLAEAGFRNYYVEAGGDLQVRGQNAAGQPWRIGIRNPFNRNEIVKTVNLDNHGLATSGTSIRGQHIYDPYRVDQPILDTVSLTVIGPNIVDADRYATAAFAMGRNGIGFIAKLEGFEGYMIDKDGIATLTPGFKEYCA
ncbi:FAD:protein FMN transferase [Patescibacteria group bacterium]|nr:FAD:protein FMN transferase [Patescibacteria group bacterium]